MIKRGMAPVHPGMVLKGLYLEPMEINITQAANKLGVARKTLSQLVNGHMGVSAEMAIRLSKALNPTPQLWMNMQQGYDLWVAEKRADDIHVEPFAIAS
jgi:addiction module HigA family antidote